MADYTTIKFETRGKVAWITINRAEVKNAFNATVIAEITAAFRDINTRKEFRAVVLTGASDAFCAGADLNWMRDVLKYSYEENLSRLDQSG